MKPVEKQRLIEDKHSRKNIRRHVLQDIDSSSEVFQKCGQCLNEYFSHTDKYYCSKEARVEQLATHPELTWEDIITELFIAVLPIEEVSPIQAVAAQLGGRLGFEHILDAVKTASEIIAVCEKARLYTIYHSTDVENDTGTLGIRPNFGLNDDTLHFIKETMYLPPMVCRPNKWHSNVDGGYLEGSGSVILGAINHHEKQQDLDSINIIQNIPWELNDVILELEELPNKPLDTQEKIDQFEIFKYESESVYAAIKATGNEFYFVWKYCKRGRMYCQGYHINLHGTQYKKAVIQFKNKELLT